MKISVIIPIYKCADTLDKCLKSVMQQDVTAMEAILVDDGSPDECPEMCDRWANSDSRIMVIHKPNGGLSSARNAGIDMATGDRLMFVDADDCLAPDTIKAMADILDKHPEYDILEFPICHEYDNGKRQYEEFGECEYRNMTDYWLTCKAYNHSYACNKVYRRQLFDSVKYPEGRVFEDIYTLPLLLDKATVVATTMRGLYVYCHNNNGITANADIAAWRMLLDTHTKHLQRFGVTATHGQNYYMQVLNIQIYESEISGDMPVLHELKIDIGCVERRFRIKALLLKILGMKRLCRINWMIRRIIKRRH